MIIPIEPKSIDLQREGESKTKQMVMAVSRKRYGYG